MTHALPQGDPGNEEELDIWDGWSFQPLPEGLDFTTRAVAAGRPRREPDAPISQPIVASSTFVAGGPHGYARDYHPTAAALEAALGDLEGGRAVAFASGMATTTAILDLVPLGAIVVAPVHSYSGTAARMRELDDSGRIKARFVLMDDTAGIAAAAEGAHTVWLETPTNPMIEIADIRSAVAAASASGGRVVVDSTFATPLVQRPLELGVDIVMHSVTKFLAGHSDALMGAAVTRDPELYEALVRRRVVMGGTPGALESFLALRGIRTLPLRLRQSMASAMTLAERLAEHPAVTRVRYPGLASDPGHAVAREQMDGFGAILSIEVVGGAAAADRICESTRIWTYATSLGGVESLLERRRRWPAEQPTVDESLIRLSVGIEDVEDLWTDLDAALQTAIN